ncbi:hypothetical protein Tco_1294939 [Tanacetum coccineum]
MESWNAEIQLLLRATLKTAPSFIEDSTKHHTSLLTAKNLDISFLHVFEALCYPKNDREDIGKLGAKAMYDDYMGGQQSKAQRTTLANQNLLTPDASTTVEESAPTPTNSLQSPNIPNTSQDVGELPQQHHVQQKDNQALLQPETDVNNV